MKSFLRACFAVGCLATIVSSSPCPAQSRIVRSTEENAKARSRWMTGYLKIEEAAKAESENNNVVALRLYREARNIFEEVSSQHPDWNPSLVEYRLSYCDERIRRLETKVKAAAEDLSKQDLVALVQELREKLEKKPALPPDVKERLAEVDKLQQQVKQLQGEKKQLQQEVTSAEEDLQKLQQLRERNRELQEELDQSAEKVADLQKQLERQAAAKDRRIAQLKAEAAEEETTVSEMKKMRDALQEEKKELLERAAQLAREKKELQANLDALRQQADATAAERKAAVTAKADLSTKLEQAKTELKQATNAVDDLQKKTTTLRRQLDAATAEKQKRTDQVKELQKTVTQQRQAVSELEKTLATYGKTNLPELEEKLQETVAKLETTRETAKTLRTKLQTLQEKEEKRQAEARKAREREQRLREEKRKKQLSFRETLKTATQFEKKNDLEQAIWHYKKALGMQPDNALVMSRLGILYADRGQDAEAEKFLSRAFEKNPNDTSILLPLGLAQLRQEKVRLAVATLTRAAALEPDNSHNQLFLGVACRSLGWSDAAQHALQRSYELDKQNMEAAYNLALYYATLDEPDAQKAAKWYKRARELGSPKDPGLEAFLND